MRAGKRSFHRALCRRLIDDAAPEGLLAVATLRLSPLFLMNTTVLIAVTVTICVGLAILPPWTSPLMASCQSRMPEGGPYQNVRILTCDVALAIAMEVPWTTCRRYRLVVMDIQHRILRTLLALHIASLHGTYLLLTRTPKHHPRAHTRRLHTNLLLRLPPYRLSLQVS